MDSVIPDTEVSLAVTNGEDNEAQDSWMIHQLAEDESSVMVKSLGGGDTIIEALRDAADRLENDEDVELMMDK